MSNYTKENLIAVPPTSVPAGTLALKVGDLIFTPGNIRIGQATEFYKCASVDTVNKTWTGFRAVLTDGVYSFEGAATEGLTYGNGLTPVVDSIYDAEALVYVNRLWLGAAALTEGLVIHAPLQYRAETAETGQAMTYPGNNCTFGNVSGVACVTLSGSAKNSVNIDSSGIVINTNPMTLACWIRYSENYFEDYFGWPEWNGYQLIIGRNSGNVLFVYGAEKWGSDYSNTTVTDNQWHHYCLTWDGDALEHILYFDGQPIMTQTETNGPRAGDGTATYMYIYSGHETSYADFRLYNRTLTPEEVALLAANLP